MNILICCENFPPSVGGVQEVCYQLAKRFSRLKNEVTVATTWHPYRKNNKTSNIKIIEFKITGNFVRGIFGETKKYINFIKSNNFDVILIYAAQQWTLDLILNKIYSVKSKVFLVPCGFSNLYNYRYFDYFKLLKKNFSLFEGFIFHTLSYRDYFFIRDSGVEDRKLHLIPNGADEIEFKIIMDKNIYKKHFGINEDILLLTNGSLSDQKGLHEVMIAFDKLNTKLNISLYINTDFNKNIISKIIILSKNIIKSILGKKIHLDYYKQLSNYAKKINFQKNKKVKIINFDRKKLIRLYKASDIFVFASKIEYSPLVIFEAMAAKNSIVSHDVGNVEEILNYTNSGILVKSFKDSSFKSQIDINDLKLNLEKLIDNQKLRDEFSLNGRKQFIKSFNWKNIFKLYSKIILN